MDNSSEQKQIAKMIRDGSYFDQSRAWYQAIYIGPIPERTFFLIIGLLAGFIALTAVLALLEFLPLTYRPRILISNDRLEDTIPSLERLRSRTGEVNPSIMNFFVRSYVERQEGYDAQSCETNYNFIRAHSNEATFTAYAIVYGSTNPQSPAAILGETGKRIVTIEDVKIDAKADPHVAVVRFTTELQGIEPANKTEWTATLQFYYSDLTVTEATDPETGEPVVETKDPQFQVINYALSKAP